MQDIRRTNSKAKNNSLNKTLQNFMFVMVNDENATAAHMSTMTMIELYRKGAWCALPFHAAPRAERTFLSQCMIMATGAMHAQRTFWPRHVSQPTPK